MNPDLISSLAVAAAVLMFVPPARKGAWLVLRGVVNVPLLLLAEVVEHRRARAVNATRPAHAPMPPLSSAGHTWQITLWVSHRGHTAKLTSGMITGPWTAAVDIEAETMTRWVATHGYPKVGKLCAQAKPVTAAAEGATLARPTSSTRSW